MSDKAYVNLPVVDFNGGAGSNNPLNRETRYKPYAEKIRANREEQGSGKTENA
ncbi:MAG TPA: hypothetical protein PKB13_09255 [Clostridia bacterium]|jgi:hypothetical protein|nr:hypothetical protein [Clostridia bacterium]